MSYQEGAIYGTVRYGTAYYGIPLNQTGGAIPAYNAAPGSADALDYQRIKITWSIPSIGTNVRLIRNSFSVPSDENDGYLLLTQGATQRPLFIDNTLTTATAGSLLYYTLWVEDNTGAWWRGLDLQAVQPKDWGYTALLTSLVPDFYLDFDDRISQTITAPTRVIIWNDLAGMTWNQLSQYDWDTLIGEAAATWNDLVGRTWEDLSSYSWQGIPAGSGSGGESLAQGQWGTSDWDTSEWQ